MLRARRQRLGLTLGLLGLAAVSTGSGGTVAPPRHAVDELPDPVPLSLALGAGDLQRPEVRRPYEGVVGDPRLAAVGHLPPAARAQARLSAAQAAASMAPVQPITGARWVERGPRPVDFSDPFHEMAFTGWGRASGRVLALAVDPRDAAGDTVYAGTSGGGLWRSSDAGRSWTPLFQHAASLTVGAVAVDGDTGTLHVGTGEPNYNATGEPGTGVYRSVDQGRSWQRSRGVPTGSHVHRIVTGRPGTVFAATSRGLYRSTDDGLSYVDVGLPTDAAGQAPYTATPYGSVVTDVVVKPGDPDSVTAVVGWMAGRRQMPGTATPQSVGNGLYRSLEAGAAGTWRRMSSPTFGRASTSGDPIGRAALAYAGGKGQDHDVMWAVIQDAGRLSGQPLLDMPISGGFVPTSTQMLNGVYRSGDDGATWELKADAVKLSHAPGSVYADPLLAAAYGVGAQSWFNQYLAVDPTDEDRVFLGLEEIYLSHGDTAAPGQADWTTIGRYWSSCRYISLVVLYPCAPGTRPREGATTPHPDHHAVALAVTPRGVRIYDGNDGGIAVQDEHEGGFDNDSWQMRNNGIGTTKPYYAAMGTDGQILTGMQDNGTALIAPDSQRGVVVRGGDGGAVAIDPVDPDVMYAEYQLGRFGATTNGGQTWTYAPPPDGDYMFIPPFSLDDAVEGHLLIGGDTVYTSTRGPSTRSSDWTPVFALKPPLSTRWRSVSATDLHDGRAYVTWCEWCYPPYADPGQAKSGLATNVERGCEVVVGGADCWHHAKGAGLPRRLLTDVAIDRRDARVVVVTAGGYETRWYRGHQPDAGHVFLSRDAGESFRDISAGLPDVPVNSAVLRGDEVFVGTDVGVFRAERPGAPFRPLGAGLPPTPVFDLTLNPQRDTLVAATHGRGVWTLSLGRSAAGPPLPPPSPARERAATAERALPATGADAAWVIAGMFLLLMGARVALSSHEPPSR